MNRVYVKHIQIYLTKKYTIAMISNIVSLWLSLYPSNVIYLNEKSTQICFKLCRTCYPFE
jgi:hypothetical protein